MDFIRGPCSDKAKEDIKETSSHEEKTGQISILIVQGCLLEQKLDITNRNSAGNFA